MSAVMLGLASLQHRHGEYIARVKASGGRILKYRPPCGCPHIETEAPKDRQIWDSLSTCVWCGDLHMKVVLFDRATAMRPGGAA